MLFLSRVYSGHLSISDGLYLLQRGCYAAGIVFDIGLPFLTRQGNSKDDAAVTAAKLQSHDRAFPGL